jgi:hypothetical protein
MIRSLLLDSLEAGSMASKAGDWWNLGREIGKCIWLKFDAG